MVTWTSEDVKQWLKEHESLNKYAKQLKVSNKTVLIYILNCHKEGCIDVYQSDRIHANAVGNNRQGAHEAD